MEAILRFFIGQFSELMDMSLTVSIVILFVIGIRLLLKRAPKVFSYALWGIVLLRLLVPVSIESPVSVVPERTAYSVMGQMNRVLPEMEFETPQDRAYNEWVRENTPPDEPFTQISRSFNAEIYLTFVWLIGMSSMIAASAVSYGRLRKRVRVCVPLRKGIYIADDIDTPFVMGILRPVIYLPGTLNTKERKYIIAHERHHIRRGDHIFKALGFLALTIHWFNPFVWAAYFLAGRDMEMSCDEAVIRKLGDDVRADYSASLLNLATGKRLFAGTPLAFDEGDPTGRVRNLAKWKKPAIWVMILCLVLCAILALCLLTDPKTDNPPETVSFEDIPYDSVTMVELKNLHNGQYSHLTSPEEIGKICEFLKDLSGTYLGSGKGYYEGTYQIQLFRDNGVIFSIGFGDSNTFHYGVGEDGYPKRYEPARMDIQEIVAFLSTYDSSGFLWASESDPQQTASAWGVSIKPQRVSRTGATAAFVYSGSVPGEEGAELTYGDFLSLERLDSGTWTPVAELPGYSYYVGDSSYPVVNGYGMVHEWPDRFGELPDGHYRMGKLVTLTRTDGSQEEQFIYGEFSLPDSILTGPIPLEDLPDKYSAEQAMLDGCFVTEDGHARENKELFRTFAENARNGNPGFIRLYNVSYANGFQWSASDLRFDGNIYTLTTDEYTYTFRYLKGFTGEKAWEDADHDAYELYILVNDEKVTVEDIYSGRLDMSDWKNPAHWTVYADFTYRPQHPQLPENPAKVTLEFEGEELVSTTDFDRLEKIWIMFQDGDILGYEPKTHSTGLGLHLILTGANGDSLVIDLDPDNDICRINGEYVFYGAYDEPCYIEKLWYYLDLAEWPEPIYAKYPNAYRLLIP